MIYHAVDCGSRCTFFLQRPCFFCCVSCVVQLFGQSNGVKFWNQVLDSLPAAAAGKRKELNELYKQLEDILLAENPTANGSGGNKSAAAAAAGGGGGGGAGGDALPAKGTGPLRRLTTLEAAAQHMVNELKRAQQAAATAGGGTTTPMPAAAKPSPQHKSPDIKSAPVTPLHATPPPLSTAGSGGSSGGSSGSASAATSPIGGAAAASAPPTPTLTRMATTADLKRRQQERLSELEAHSKAAEAEAEARASHQTTINSKVAAWEKKYNKEVVVRVSIVYMSLGIFSLSSN